MLGWSPGEAVILLVLAQVLLSAIAVFTGRAVMPLWLGGALAALVVLVLIVEVGRAQLEHDRAPGFTLPVKLVIGAFIVARDRRGVAPVALVVNDAKTLMENGREAASRGLASARDGDTITASASFHEAALTFAQARDKLDSPFLSGGLAIPLLAPNVRAARTLAEIGTDLADAGESVTLAVDPAALEVVDGRLPLEEVRTITPKLRAGRRCACASATGVSTRCATTRTSRQPVRDAVGKVHTQLARADREAQHAAVAAELAPGDLRRRGTRAPTSSSSRTTPSHAQPAASSGATGSSPRRTASSTSATCCARAPGTTRCATLPDVTFDAPDDYRTRYTQFAPATTLQNVNLSPDFPSVAQVLMSLAPQAGLTKVDGVLAVDPRGARRAPPAHRARSTSPAGPRRSPPRTWSQVTLRDAYAAFADTPERADFLGDVAQVAVDEATSGNLGRPAQIAKVLGGAAHEGHLMLAFARPEEQELAVELGVSGRMDPVRSDAVAVTTSNAAANKIDYYLQRSVRYTVQLDPNARATVGPRVGLARRHARQHRPGRGTPADRDRAVRPAVLRR